MDEDIPALIRYANEQYDNQGEDYSEIDDETPLAVLLARKQSKDPGQKPAFNLLIYNLGVQELDDIATNDNNDDFPVGPFRARLWTEPGDRIIRRTTFEYGSEPKWPDTMIIRFDNKVDDGGFLYVEIVRHGIEPCTSDGETTVGRAKFPLPEGVDTQKRGQEDLVRSDGGECRIGAAKVNVCMKWQRDD